MCSSDLLATVLKDPDMVKRLFDLGVVAEPGTAEQLAQYLEAEHARWAKLTRDIGFIPE